MKKIQKLLTISALFLLAPQSYAAVTFSGIDGSLDFNASSGMFTINGIQVTITANDGNVNATSSGLGVNDTGSGDDTNGIDTINLVETLTISFNQDVIFNTITLSDFGVDDGLDASFNGSAAISLASGSQSLNVLLSAGNLLVLTATEPNAPTSNNGVVINNFTVSAVPEPSSSALLGLGGLALLLRRRK